MVSTIFDLIFCFLRRFSAIIVFSLLLFLFASAYYLHLRYSSIKQKLCPLLLLPHSTPTESSSMDSHYTLHPSDNPGALITPVILRGDNYSEWDTEFSNSLQSKQKIRFIDRTITKLDANPDLARWISTNSMILGWIRASIDPQVRSTVTHVPDAHKLWEFLKRSFSVKNNVRKHLLKDEITNCKQNRQSVLEYYDRLSKLCE